MKIQYGFNPKHYREENLETQLGANWRKKIFEITLTNICNSVYPQGLKSIQARSFNRILNTLDQTQSETEIDISQTDAEFLKAVCFHDNASIPSAQAPVYCLILDAIDSAFKKLYEEQRSSELENKDE